MPEPFHLNSISKQTCLSIMEEVSKVKVTVITGFLGSGKTTLLNYILQAEHGKKIAVIEVTRTSQIFLSPHQNEFGEVGIDDALVISANEEIFEMNNG